ncbi:glyoxylase-like metal-dependent hydrolase (beta-lactamase superfamily II) [Anoxybacillus mongoliensis]|uniref:Glyoxylase-like metal-dependent hydrolase (Beta-lactamase superfamily II) n=1 Tax=Anoxybacillus mongoliensis TaxID=452565 RepID=A0A7W8JEY7_9BACL|nr:MBL fold metallo-hydrolase [Anoxybacillus mongoliensis]MBB5354474.1 glyoxylase-like metal-dependent hydrolase (beta-lactamase superfamily II) [Anoxybacillus mongoliensis]
MKWKRIPLGPLQTNAYVLAHENGTCLIFDPGSEGRKLIQYIEENGWTPLAVLLTHAHFDHIGAVDDVRNHWSIPVYVHKKEQHWLTDPMKNGSLLFMGEAIITNDADVFVEGEKTLTIGPFCIQLLETPGHSPGSLSYYIEDAQVVVSGDVLFSGSIGRTDLPGGSYEQLLQSIHRKLLILPEETVVLCGHGSETTIGAEMDTNPFLNGF